MDGGKLGKAARRRGRQGFPSLLSMAAVGGLGESRRSLWALSGLNCLATGIALFAARIERPGWVRFPGSEGGFGLAVTLLLLWGAVLVGTTLGWNELGVKTREAPSWKRFATHAAGSGALAGLLFAGLVLLVFYVPAFGISSMLGLLSFALPALALGAVFGIAVGLLDVVVLRLLGAKPGKTTAGEP